MKRRNWIIVGVVVLLVAGGIAWSIHRRHERPADYATAPIERGEIVEVVRASGTVRPLRLVQVGTQVNGPIAKLMADFNDTVKAGQVIAQIDPAAYAAHVGQSQATVTQSEASVDAARARLAQADIELKRAGELTAKNLIAQSEFDVAKANRDVLAAQMRLSEASLEQSRAALRLAQTDLDYTTIRSPVDGVVVERNVNEGQTVVASMSAQTIFTIAADLSIVLVEVSVPEADIGRIQKGQPVTFSVDAYPDSFTGVVQQVRLSGTSVQNVVTYPVIVSAPNPANKLLPGMTANLACEVARHADALKAPNAALRFRPEAPAGDKPKSSKGGAAPTARKAGKSAVGPQLWVQGEDGPKAIPVTTGITDGAFTEIVEPAELKEGLDVIVGLEQSGQASTDKVNPFAPTSPFQGVGDGFGEYTMLIELQNIHKVYRLGEVQIPALCDVNLSVDRGDFLAIMGASGSGKSTLLNILGCLDIPSAGTYRLDGVDVSGMTSNQLAGMRNARLGFVFQSFNLLSRTSALENVEMPLMYGPALPGREMRARALAMLGRVGLADRVHHHPGQLSGGQQQRVAIARALIKSPAVMLADEPTGNLDSKSGDEIMAMLKELNEGGLTIIMVTHEDDIARQAHRIIRMRDGRIT